MWPITWASNSSAARHAGGGAAALRELLVRSQRMNLTITPDGPRGPRRRLAQGPVYLASKIGMPIVAMGFGYDRPWRFNSWDRFAIPRPYSRARGVVSPMMNIPPDLDRDGIEHYRMEVERMLNRLTLEAEAWAEAGTRKENEYVPRRERFGTGRDTALGWPLFARDIEDAPRGQRGTERAA